MVFILAAKELASDQEGGNRQSRVTEITYLGSLFVSSQVPQWVRSMTFVAGALCWENIAQLNP